MPDAPPAGSFGAHLVGRRVLLVHGSFETGEALARALTGVGVLVLGPGDGEQALALLRTDVLVDAAVISPDLAAAAQIEDAIRGRGAPVIAWTADDPAELASRVADALAAG